uniref:DUF759 family protein n=2 Tax=Borreliella afzelii TaxID=29518 RepID=UPI003AF486F2
TGELMADLVSSGQFSMQEAATAIDEYIRGYGGTLFKMMSATKVGSKYTIQALGNYERDVESKDFNFRFKNLAEVASDYKKFGLSEHADEKEKIDSNLTRFEQSVKNVTAAGMQPVLEGASRIIDWVEDLIKTYNTGGITGIISKMITSAISSIGSAIGAAYRNFIDSLPEKAQRALKFLGLKWW